MKDNLATQMRDIAHKYNQNVRTSKNWCDRMIMALSVEIIKREASTGMYSLKVHGQNHESPNKNARQQSSK
jgi:hypothetical protein